ncbi:hypothetical protein [Nocardioides sp.]|uniref:hypothetical protein n=1 Tax=Nocardioides sp. TaxID=35761 RepID=UPI002B755A8C|nr:hypothetical protein [Nocardioides sp.]HXH80867.1 hypothetical protein [Nocardioides sp.]
MAIPRPLPLTGSIFFDARGQGRALRVTWHHDADLVVVSLWRDNECSGSFRLPVEEVPALIDMLQRGLEASYAVKASREDHAKRRPVRFDHAG